MGSTQSVVTQSVLNKHGYTVLTKVDCSVIATAKDGDNFVIKEIHLNETSEETRSDIETLKQINHPHIVRHQNSFEDDNSYYIVMDHCEGGNLSQKIKGQIEAGQPFSEEQIIDWLAQICMALKLIHNQDLLHRGLRPQSIFLTKFGTLRVGEFGRVNENGTHPAPSADGTVGYLDPETLSNGMYDAKSDIWSMGCILYELCMLKCSFTEASTIKLIPQILHGPYPSLPESFSSELCSLLSDIFQRDPAIRPSAREILGYPFIISSLTKKSAKTVEELQTNLQKLWELADGLERVHQGTTIGSLTGSVVGAAGGITSLVGLILAPFTLGASLIVTGVGVGVAVAGGATAGISNITNMVNQTADREAVRNIVKEFQEKMTSVVTSLQEISEGLEEMRQHVSTDVESPTLSPARLAGVAVGTGRSLVGITELSRLVQVANLGKVAAQAARAVRVAEVATGILSGFFVAVDIFFIVMDAKEIHNIRQAKAAELSDDKKSGSRLEWMDTDSTTELEPESEEPTVEIKSKTMKFVQSIRQTAEQLQESLDELRDIMSVIPQILEYEYIYD